MFFSAFLSCGRRGSELAGVELSPQCGSLTLLVHAALFAAMTLTGCSSDSNPRTDAQLPDVSTGDVSQGDANPGEADFESDADRGDTASSDAQQFDAADISDQPQRCLTLADCDEGRICLGGQCREKMACDRPVSYKACIEAYQAFDAERAQRAYCSVEGFCEVACLGDSECGAGYVCVDHGYCRRFEGEVTGEKPGSGSRTPFRAGVGEALLRYPIGMSLGGYALRLGAASRYTESLRPSHGQMHALYARAVALDNGLQQMLIVRVPMIFSTMEIHEAVARQLQEQTGSDWRDALVITATHTHSGPARFWHLPRDTRLPLGVLGIDEFHQHVFDWIVESIVEASQLALQDLEPARMGWTIVEGFDIDDRVASDRWGETPSFDDNRLLIWRLDDLEGKPRAVLVSFGMHGIIHESDYFTGDAPGGIEFELQDRLGQEYDQFVPVLFVNQNGGSMSPRGDDRDYDEGARYERLGHLFLQKAWEAVRDVETKTDIAMRSATYRFPLSYETVGYRDGEWTSKGEDYRLGGLQCSIAPSDRDWTTVGTLASVECLNVGQLTYNRPVGMFFRSQITAIEIDGLTVITLPGEPTMELGWQVLRELREQHDVDPLKAFIFGYAQDHLFYFTPSNLRGERPPFAGLSTPMAPDDYPDQTFSYFQGGAEAEMNLWGPKLGDFLVERAVESIGLLRQEGAPPRFDGTLPSQFSRQNQEPFPLEETPEDRVGVVTLEPPEVVERLEPIEFAWLGGDPSAEMPQAPWVVLQREVENGNFEDVIAPSQRPYSNREPYMLTRVRKPSSDTEEPAWEWVVHWEELQSFPVGNYRFRLVGHYQTAGERKSYTTYTRRFEFRATDAMVVSNIQAGERTWSAEVSYPPAEELDFLFGNIDGGRIRGSFRMRDIESALPTPAPLRPERDLSAEGIAVRLRSADGTPLIDASPMNPTIRIIESGLRFITVLEGAYSPLSPGSYTLELEVTDAYGNQGSASQVFEVIP